MTPVPALDPKRDCQKIARNLATMAFAWDTTRALELALFRTFAAQRIGGLLHRTAEFELRAQKRYDDTDLLVSEIIEHGFDSPRGSQAIARINALHGRFRIGNDDFLYVLSSFVFEPIRWNERFGWRRMSEAEKLAWFWFWKEVGERMMIRDIPGDYAAFERYSRAYEQLNFRCTPASRSVALATRELFAGWFPALLRPLVRSSIHALLDAPLLAAFDLQPAPPWLTWLVEGGLRARARALRWLPHRRRPRLRTQLPRGDYPEGYRIESLGPASSGQATGAMRCPFSGEGSASVNTGDT